MSRHDQSWAEHQRREAQDEARYVGEGRFAVAIVVLACVAVVALNVFYVFF